jgi:hypothetical protein
MTDIPKSEQDSAGPYSSNQTPSGQPSFDREEALNAIASIFGIKEAALVFIFDYEGKMHPFPLDPKGSWKQTKIAQPSDIAAQATSTAQPSLASDATAAADATAQPTITAEGEKCCFHVPAIDGSNRVIIMGCHDMPGVCGP